MRRIPSVLLLLGTAAALNAQSAPVPLKVPTRLGAYVCAPGKGNSEPRVFADGKVEQCLLAQPAEFFGRVLDAGNVINLNRNGTPKSVWLARNTELDGHVCRGTGPGGWSVEFHPSGSLRACFLEREEIIQGVPCRKGTFWTEVTGGSAVAFYENGQLERCHAARSFTAGGYTFRARQPVHLEPDGSVRDPTGRRAPR